MTSCLKHACAALVMLGLSLVNADGKSLHEMSWGEVVASAKAEKEVVWYQWYYQPRFRDELKRFEQTYGIKVIIPDNTLEASVDKLIADRDKAEGEIDLLSTGGNTLQGRDLQQLLFGPLRSLLPDGKQLTYVKDDFDNGGYSPAFWGNQTCIAYDSKRISEPELPRDLDQFSAFFRDRPNMFGFNLARGGSGPSFYSAVIRALTTRFNFQDPSLDPERMARLKSAFEWLVERKDGFMLTTSNNDSLARLASGELVITPVWEDALITAQREGRITRDIGCYIPDFGMVGGGNVLSVPANAKHKAAALLLADWLTSAQTQADLSRIFSVVPQRADVGFAAGVLDAEARRRSLVWAAEPFKTAMEKALIDALGQK